MYITGCHHHSIDILLPPELANAARKVVPTVPRMQPTRLVWPRVERYGMTGVLAGLQSIHGKVWYLA
ncbi:uncharacterized protein GLRG_11962 [Colletotrichum graminicola M1.001]|uniref:Uncharacterized protein n=1 Tax=Colletotrichum graminicola (strain M1.001 / M2 / FGSC 10212) TaxID=645133 RepID=E3R128_COLGM|nr:uncharacterized protein GLRG_11962 [Colletotrichum graminicola M1.001]EFQ36816.1 hypothetical protein GLRG_11962 [Colletotrichum graminicola M1.001]